MVLYALVSLLVLAEPSADGWNTYANSRYGYSVAVPAGLQGQGESGNGDGQEFQDSSGKAVLKVWAAPVVELDGTPESKTDLAWNRKAAVERWRKQKVRITYQPKGKGWWVLSGEDAQGRIVYLKQLEKEGVVYGFEWSHPKGAKAWQDATARIARGFTLP
ncbi:hypothetical protein [Stigmatella erecta]|uniref:Uncharacterized protein n=1 Tax=Stigmatella erecta TaxID=83460 RepID=A0A1I0H0X1_9BACT|nr:hypothetical protein [Stigmatella erecta]SET77168.1 hypothetical protein SAMN05443639_104261 [Stigmatella erecta]